jgi:hypothetical protein
MDVNHRVFPSDIETGEGAELLSALKLEIERDKKHVVKYFRSAKDLHAKVLLSLRERLRQAESGEASSPDLAPQPSKAQAGGVAPELESQAVQAARHQLLRIEAQGRSDSTAQQLRINLGFSRIWIRDAGGRRLPLVCGCAIARSEVRFQGGRSNADPSCAILSPEARLVVEFGTGPRPVVRLETCPPRPFLEGRTELVFEVKQDTIVAANGTPLRGTITLEPEWFATERPAGVSAQPAITEEVEALLNAWLDELQRQSPAALSFTL